MKLTAENSLKIQRFFQQYQNKSLWQIETVVENFLNDLVKDEVNKELDSIGYGILNRKRD